MMIHFVAGEVLFLVQKIRIEFSKALWMPESLSGSMVLWWSYMHMCILCVLSSVTSQVAMVNTIMC